METIWVILRLAGAAYLMAGFAIYAKFAAQIEERCRPAGKSDPALPRTLAAGAFVVTLWPIWLICRAARRKHRDEQ